MRPLAVLSFKRRSGNVSRSRLSSTTCWGPVRIEAGRVFDRAGISSQNAKQPIGLLPEPMGCTMKPMRYVGHPNSSNRSGSILLLGLILVGLGGCFGTTRLHYAENSLAATRSHVTEVSRASLFWGLSQPASINIAQYCGTSGVATIQVDHTIGDWALAVVTFGVYSPTTVSLTCQ